jgi:hypothetical protein
MSDEPKKRSRAWIGWASALSFLVIYVLSVGPMGWLWTRGYIPYRLFYVLYAPLDWAYVHSNAVRRVADWYYYVWGGPPG